MPQKMTASMNSLQLLGSARRWTLAAPLDRAHRSLYPGHRPVDYSLARTRRGVIAQLVALPFPAMALALANRGSDAARFDEPWATQLAKQGLGRKWWHTDRE